jgi:hypothetical protein
MIAVTIALLACSLIFYLVDDIPATRWLLLFCLMIWLLVAAIVTGNAASTFRIDEEFLTYRLFGFWVRRIPVSEIRSFRTELGFWPGIFELTNGSTIRVSGIAVGQTDTLSKFLATHHPHIEQAIVG